MASAEDIESGQWIICPGCTVPAPIIKAPAQSPKPQHAQPQPSPQNRPTDPESQSSPKIQVSGGHSFPKGYCTYYVASKMKISFGGNAKNWLGNAAAAGYADADVNDQSSEHANGTVVPLPTVEQLVQLALTPFKSERYYHFFYIYSTFICIYMHMYMHLSCR